MAMSLDFQTGWYNGRQPQGLRRLGELTDLFAQPEEIAQEELLSVVYELHGSAPEIEGPPQLLNAVTVLHPGQVGNEYFMTRGHFHTNPERGEFMLTLRGEGALVLMDRSRETWMEEMSQGTVHNIDGHHAHRVVNTGSESLIFLVVWMSDCGHDYDSIREHGFGKRLLSTLDGPTLT